ncbi:MAG: START domain-containing protein [Bacteroidota bacterium]
MQATKFQILSFLAALLPLLPAQLFSQNKAEWQLKRKSGGVEVYTREAEDSPFKELKFLATFEASLSSIAAILNDVEHYDEWVYKSSEAELIKKVNDREMYYYERFDFPWPLDDRDVVAWTQVWQDPKTLALHSKTNSAHWLRKELDDVVRIKKMEIEWIFTPIGNGKIRSEYYLKTDPGGSLPAWLVNLAADQGPLQTMIDFKEMLKTEKFKDAKLAFVQEKK